MKRPTSVTVFGVLNIVFAGFGIVGILASIALLASNAPTNNPVAKVMRDNAAYATWVKVSLPFGVIGLAALLTSGIGLLLFKSWARKLAIGYAIYAIVFGLAGTVANFLFLAQPMLEEARHKQGAEAGAAIGGAIGGMVGGCIGLIYPVLLIIFMTRAKIVEAFAAASGNPPPMPPA